MQNKLAHLIVHYKSEGAAATFKFIATKISNRLIKKIKKNDHAFIFSEIYKKNLWKSQESRSGEGSELSQTKNLIEILPSMLEQFQIKTIIDAPCGDFNWMKHVPLNRDLHYIGLDIVPELINDNQKKYGNSQYRFQLADLTKNQLPKAELLFCRDCLFHLSYKDIYLVLNNFVQSDIPFLLTTTHLNTSNFKNSDIQTGSFRQIDLFSEPFFLPSNVHFRIEDFVAPATPREMCLWDKAQVKSALEKMSQAIF